MFAILFSLLACNEVEPQPVPVVDWADVECSSSKPLALPDGAHVVSVLGCRQTGQDDITEECGTALVAQWATVWVADATDLNIGTGEHVSAICEGEATYYRVTWIEQP